MARHRRDPICPSPRGLVTHVRIDPLGVTGRTRSQSVGRHWRRTSPGLFVPTDDSSVVEQRVLEVAARLPGQGAVTGWAACRLHRATFFDGLARDGRTELPVPVAVGRKGRVRDRDGRMLVRLHDVPDHERATRLDIPTVTAVRATDDAMRLSSSREPSSRST
ncbi:hypothetical protein [Nocardioides sp. InS609-2]|uniref:hypothetical protein n=1 Tax=Nocardioides sp. InS609-2 TaxID=2760705 RepID=UPI0020BFC956|nr:hypothetical protein [Nocardioides sp. InS609-2]